MRGRIAQIEPMGLFDGPGLRVVVFMQGCPLRCKFCHNPEMWKLKKDNEYTAEELIKIILKYQNYFNDGGGITFSGGEPLTQPEFLIECLKLCHNTDIHTTLDTSGVGDSKYFEEILKYTDLVIYDIKAIDSNKYKDMTGVEINKSLEFLNMCQKLNKKLWIRSVIVPGINDNEKYILELSTFIKKLNNVEKIELLPYHTMGKNKYKKLGIKYGLENTNAMDTNKCNELEKKLIQYIGI